MRLSQRAIGKYPIWVRLILLAQKRKYGFPLQPTLLWGRSPRLLMGLQALYSAIDRSRSPIEPALRSMVTVLVSQINHCAFCIDVNSATLQKRGVSTEKILELKDYLTSTHYTQKEKVALRYAEAMTRTDLGVDQKLFDELRNHFGEDQIVELTAVVSYQNMSSKFNSALDVPAQGFCPLPMQGAKPQSSSSNNDL